VDFARFAVILVGSDVPGGQDGPVRKLADSEKPILALGEGGYDFFGTLNLRIGSPHGWHGRDTALAPVAPSESGFWRPLKLDTLKDRRLEIYRESGHVGIHVPEPIDGVVLLGREAADPAHYPLLRQDPRYVFWGFTGAPDAMTELGRRVFVQACRYTAASRRTGADAGPR
jgi:hypothetical protein